MKKAFFVGFLLISLKIFSQAYEFYEKEPFSLENLSLKGKVKEMRVIIYFLNDDNEEKIMHHDTLQDINFEFKENGLVNKLTTFYYGKKQQIIEYEYNPNGVVLNYIKKDGNNDLVAIYNNSFDEKNRLIKHPNCYNDVGAYDTYTYDEQGKLIEENYISPYYIYTRASFLYDVKGNVIEKKVYDKNGDFSHRIEYKYDEMANIIEENKYNGKNVLVNENKTSYTYNKKGKIISEEWKTKRLIFSGDISTASEENEGKTNYLYDKFDNLTKIIDKNSAKETSYKNYEFGNWGEKKSNDDGYDYFEIRKFIYY